MCSYQFSLALNESLLVQPSLPGHGESGVGSGAEQGEVAAVLIQTIKCFLQLDVHILVLSLHLDVDLVQVLLQLVHHLGQSIAGVHPPPVVRLESSDVETWLVISEGEEVVESVMGLRLEWRSGAVPGCLQSILI